MKLQINKNPSIIFGLAQLIDGIIRVISFGFVFTNLPLIVSRNQAFKNIKKGN